MELQPHENTGKTQDLSRKKAASLFLALVAFAGPSLSFDFNPNQPKIYRSANPDVPADDGKLTISTNNTKLSHEYLSRVIVKHNVDISANQEVRGDDAQKIVDRVPGSTGIFAPGDYPVQIFSGGQGIMTVSRGLKVTEEMRQFDGKIAYWDMITSLDQLDFRGVAMAYKERRAALVSRFVVETSGVKLPLNLMNVHITNGELGDRQRNQVLDYIEEELDDPASINLAVGDFNKTPKGLRVEFSKLSREWVVADIGPTSRATDQQIDHIIYQPYVTLGDKIYKLVVQPKVIDDKGSDHRAIVAVIELERALPVKNAS
jgi:endonuclease/exonuclease/phosphatase family metal-dependent hydrolase